MFRASPVFRCSSPKRRTRRKLSRRTSSVWRSPMIEAVASSEQFSRPKVCQTMCGSIAELQNKTNSCRVGFGMQLTRKEPAMDAVAPDRYRMITWQDPAVLRRAAHDLTGLELLHRIASRQLPPPPVADLVGFAPAFVAPGHVVFTYEPREEHLNALCVVHGGIVTTILDTAMSCAVHSELERGVAYATVELKTSFVRPVTPSAGPLRAEGRVVHGGRQVATAEAKLVDELGTLFATATSTSVIVAAHREKLAA